MPPRPRIDRTQITEAAIDLIDEEGFEALTLSLVAARLGVGPSALYSYLDGLDGLRHEVAIASTDNLAVAVRTAAIGHAGRHALEAMGTAYRGFATNHPGQFASTLLAPGPEDGELARANQALLDVFVLVYGAMGLSGDESHLAARSTRSAIHGFLALEHNSGTNGSHAEEYQHLLATLQRGLDQSPESTRRRDA